MPDHYLLQWSNHLTNIAAAFSSLRQNNKLVDVTLAADGRSVQAHKVVLCACSAYFEELLSSNPCKHPIVYLKDVQYDHLSAVVEFMYNGAVYVGNEQLDDVIKLGANLRVRGMVDVNMGTRQFSNDENKEPETPAAKRRKKRTAQSRDNSTDEPVKLELDPASTPVSVPPPPALTGPPLYTLVATQAAAHAPDTAAVTVTVAAGVTAQPTAEMLPQGKPATVPTAAERKAAPPRSYSEGDMGTKVKELDVDGEGVVPRQKRCVLQRQPRIKRECDQPATAGPAASTDDPAIQQQQPQQGPAGSTSVETLVLDVPAPGQAQATPGGSYLAVPAPTQYWPPVRQMSTPTPVLSSRESALVKQGSMPSLTSHTHSLAPSLSQPAPVQKQRSTPVLSRGASGPAFFMVNTTNMPMVVSQTSSQSVPHILLTSAEDGAASAATMTPTTAATAPCRSHAPVLRDGPAVSCSHCWNTEYSQGRTLRRKTKYMCRDCSVSLCIVPCFQEYHETVKTPPLVVSRDPNKPITKKILPKLGSL